MPQLIIDEKEATLVRYIFYHYINGKGYKAIANQLNKEGYKPKRMPFFAIPTREASRTLNCSLTLQLTTTLCLLMIRFSALSVTASFEKRTSCGRMSLCFVRCSLLLNKLSLVKIKNLHCGL
ncbi:recombinase family protein [Fontibacillus panacisegetis]|uniref:recombinase family protein n=1 Tax=Fontibacillus solani TaxID=1572857 RepID=UPI0015FAE550|nr:recombinase family protein [Fontibacillus solani]